MQRSILPQTQVHSAIHGKMAAYHQVAVDEVKQAIAAHDVVVVGMKLNPFPGKARRLLASHGIAHTYLEWGSYLSKWRARLAIIVKGVLIGGYSDLEKMLASGEFVRLLAAPRAAA
jgi:monothiol glutaredoxin